MENMISLSEIQTAKTRLQDVAIHTPLQYNDALSAKYACNIYLKREDQQVVRSFKIRGAYNKIASLSEEQLKNGVVCASAGNHAQGVAFACDKLQVKGIIYMPVTTPNQKIRKVRHFGGSQIEIVLVGDTFDDAQTEAWNYTEKSAATFVHPFNDRIVAAGQGTVALEIMQDLVIPLDFLVVAVGGGGLISGVGSYMKQVSPLTKIIAVEAEGAAALLPSLESGKIVKLEKIDSFADGIAVKKIGDINFKICQEVVDEILTVPEGKICSTILELYNDQAIVAEPAGAIGVSALDYLKDEIKGKNVAIILCGGNNDINRTNEIRERSLLWEEKKHYFIVNFPQRAGALRDFLNLLGPNDDITFFEYNKKRNRETGPALIGIEVKNIEDHNALLVRMDNAEINYRSLNKDPLLFETLI